MILVVKDDQMNYLLLLSTALLCTTYNEAKTEYTYCSDEKELVKSDLEVPHHMALDFHTNTLFFTVGRYGNVSEEYIQLNTKSHGKIQGSDGINTVAIDQANHIIYLGGFYGIYKYNYIDNSAIKLNITEDDTFHLFFKDNLYYSVILKKKVFVVKDGIKSTVEELTAPEPFKIKYIGLDEQNNIFFSKMYGLYEYKKDLGNITKVSDKVINGFAVDKDGYLYFSAWDGIYKINNGNIEKIYAEDHIHGFAIDADYNIIYSTRYEIYKLKRTNTHCY